MAIAIQSAATARRSAVTMPPDPAMAVCQEHGTAKLMPMSVLTRKYPTATQARCRAGVLGEHPHEQRGREHQQVHRDEGARRRRDGLPPERDVARHEAVAEVPKAWAQVPTRPSTPSPTKSHSIGTKDRDESFMSYPCFPTDAPVPLGSGRSVAPQPAVVAELVDHALEFPVAEHLGLEAGREQREVLPGEVLDLHRDRQRIAQRGAERHHAVIGEQRRAPLLEAANGRDGEFRVRRSRRACSARRRRPARSCSGRRNAAPGAGERRGVRAVRVHDGLGVRTQGVDRLMHAPLGGRPRPAGSANRRARAQRSARARDPRRERRLA